MLSNKRGRPRVESPRVSVRRRGDSWRLRWYDGQRNWEFAIDVADEKTAETARMQIELALRTGEWPEWAAPSPTVQRWLTRGDCPSGGSNEDLLADFLCDYTPTVSESWAQQSRAAVREFADWRGARHRVRVDGELAGHLPPPLRRVHAAGRKGRED